MFYKYHYANTYNFMHFYCNFYGCENDNFQIKKKRVIFGYLLLVNKDRGNMCTCNLCLSAKIRKIIYNIPVSISFLIIY